MRAANVATIVVINCSKIQGDTIIVTPSGATRIPLPYLKYEEAENRLKVMAEQLFNGPSRTRGIRNERLMNCLGWLWLVVIVPVCLHLDIGLELFHRILHSEQKDETLIPQSGSYSAKQGTLPRLCWIGVGMMSQAPFHAAGLHDSRPEDSIIEIAVFSYTPTIKALIYVKERASSASKSRLTLAGCRRLPGIHL